MKTQMVCYVSTFPKALTCQDIQKKTLKRLRWLSIGDRGKLWGGDRLRKHSMNTYYQQ